MKIRSKDKTSSHIHDQQSLGQSIYQQNLSLPNEQVKWISPAPEKKACHPIMTSMHSFETCSIQNLLHNHVGVATPGSLTRAYLCIYALAELGTGKQIEENGH